MGTHRNAWIEAALARIFELGALSTPVYPQSV